MRSHAQTESLSFKAGVTRRKATLLALASLWFVSLLATEYLGFRYARLNPTRPQPETGRVRPYSAYKGTRVYVSEREETVARALFASSFVWLGALIFFGYRWRFVAGAGGGPRLPAAYEKKNE